MSDHAPFFQAIADAPNDPTPLWIYADWLEEHGDSDRAEFVRVQTELTRLPDDDPRKIDLEIANRRWLAERGKEWREELPGWSWIGWHGFEDGLPRVVNIDGNLKTNVQGAFEGIYQIAPVNKLRFLRLTEESARAIAECSLLHRITAIELGDDMPEPSLIEILLRSPHLTNLRQLICPAFPRQTLGQPVGSWLDSFALPQLDRLVLRGKPIFDAGAVSLAQSQTLKRLSALSLPDHRLTDTGVEAILNSPNLGILRELDLSRNGLDRHSAERFAQHPALASLTRLFLFANSLGDRGAEALSRSPHLKSLTTLDLSGNEIGDRGLIALLRMSKTGSLARLFLQANQITLRDNALFPKRRTLSRLISLALQGNHIEADNVSKLIGSPLFANLRSLALNPSAAEALAHISIIADS